MKVRRLRLENMTLAERTWCKNNNLGHRGSMLYQFNACWANKNHPDCVDRVYLCVEDDQLVGWALYFLDWHREVNAYLFVPAKNRRNGYGRALAGRIMKDNPDVIFHPWDKTSCGFFNEVWNRELVH